MLMMQCSCVEQERIIVEIGERTKEEKRKRKKRKRSMTNWDNGTVVVVSLWQWKKPCRFSNVLHS